MVGQPPDAALEPGDLLRVSVIPDDPANDAELARAQIPRPSFYLLRPDGHVGLCGRAWSLAVRRYRAERLHPAYRGASGREVT